VELKKTFSELVETHGKNNEKKLSTRWINDKKAHTVFDGVILGLGCEGDVGGLNSVLRFVFVGVIGRTWWCSKPNSGHQK
jgi:hypothetical protein